MESPVWVQLQLRLHDSLMTQNSSNNVFPSSNEAGRDTPVGLTVDDVIERVNRYSAMADALVGEIDAKCMCHRNCYSNMTHALCKNKCAKLAKQHILHAALSRKYLAEHLSHLDQLYKSNHADSLDTAQILMDMKYSGAKRKAPTEPELSPTSEPRTESQSGVFDLGMETVEVQSRLDEIIEDSQEIVRQVAEWTDDDLAVIPPDIGDEFCMAVSTMDSAGENPITFFESLALHLEEHTWRYHFDKAISQPCCSYTMYIQAMQMLFPHLERDIMAYILYCTKHNDWEETISVMKLIIEARSYSAAKTPVEARQRMGINDQIEPQAGLFNFEFFLNMYKDAPWRDNIHNFPAIATRVVNRMWEGYVREMDDQAENPEGLTSATMFFENLMLFYQEYRRAETMTDFILCYYKFLKMQFHISFASNAMAWIGVLVNELSEDEPDAQSGVCFADVVEAYKSVTQSALFEKMSKLAMLVGSLAVYWMAGENLTLDAFGKICKQVYSGLKATDLFGQILETIQSMYARCIPYMKGEAPFSSVWQGLGDGRQLDMDIVTFIGFANKYVEGTAEATGPAPEALMVRATCILDKLTLLLRATTKDMDRVPLKRSILLVEGLRNAINNKFNNCGVRAKPFTLSLFGTTGVGKTCLSFELAVMLQRALKVDAGTQFIYRKDESDEYDSSLNNLHNTYILDDLGNTNPDKAKTVCTEPIIAYANNCPKFAVMADLASKGVVAVKPKVLIITTNIKDLHAKYYSIAPDAVLRRVENHITVTVKPEYADVNGQLREDVDPLAVNFDCWLFDVQRFSRLSTHPKAIKGFEPVVSSTGEDLLQVSFEKLCRHLVEHARRFHARQDAYVEHTKVAHLQEYCECGMRLSACTLCALPAQMPALQAGAFDEAQECLSRVMGLKEVMLYPIGRGMVAEAMRTHFFNGILLSLAALAADKLISWDKILVAWVAVMTLFVLVSIYRVYTYKVKISVDNVCGKLARQYVKHVLGPRAKLLAGFVAMAGAYTAYTKLSKYTVVQGSIPSRPRVNIEMGKLPPTWTREQLAPLPVNPNTINGTGAQLAEVLRKKMCSLRVYSQTTQEFAATFPICTNFWIVPHHLIVKPYEMVKIVDAGDDVINNSITLFREGSYRRIGRTDFALLYVPGKGDQLDIIKYFPSEDMFKNGRPEHREIPSRLVLYEQTECVIDGNKVLKPESSVHGVRITNCSISPKGIDVAYWGGSYTSPTPTFAGMCGCPIMADHPGPYIAGLHSAGITGSNAANFGTVMREDVLKCMQEMVADTTPMMQGSQSGPMKLGGDDMPFMHALPKNSHFAYMEKAEVDILGCHAGRKRRYTSMVQPTDYSDDIAELFGVDRKHGKPALINHWYPARLWAESCANCKPVHMTFLTQAYQNYAMRIFKYLKEDHKEDICVLEDIVNTSGLDGCRGLQKMNYSASAGIPYGKPKKEYVKQSEDFFDGITVPYELTDDMRKDVEELENIYKQGLRGYAPHRANRKDEAIKLEKAKVRIFSGTNMPYLFLMRKYFLTISVFMQKHPEVFESAVGINPYSDEWSRLYKYITKFGTSRTIAGDYEKYDQFVHSMMTYAAFKILIRIAEWAGFDEEDLLVMRGLATDTCNPVYELDGLWIKVGGSSPSGHALTVVINGVVNSLYARVAYYKRLSTIERPMIEVQDFNRNVAFMSYGDDNVMTVHERADFFNHCTYQEALRDYGLNYTMADKTAESVPYIPFEEASFLKRTWVWSEEFKRHYAPLEKDSIFKMLHTFGVSKVAPRQQQLADILRSANQEFFMHGDDVYANARTKLMIVADKYELSHFLPNCTLPSLDEMKAWYRVA